MNIGTQLDRIAAKIDSILSPFNRGFVLGFIACGFATLLI